MNLLPLKLNLDPSLKKFDLFSLAQTILSEYYENREVENDDWEDIDPWEQVLQYKYSSYYSLIENLQKGISYRDAYFICRIIYGVKGFEESIKTFCDYYDLGYSSVWDGPYKVSVTIDQAEVKDFTTFSADMLTFLFELMYLSEGDVSINYNDITIDFVISQPITLSSNVNVINIVRKSQYLFSSGGGY